MPLVELAAKWMRLSWEWAMVMMKAGKKIETSSIGIHCMLVILIFYWQQDDFLWSHVPYVCDGHTFSAAQFFWALITQWWLKSVIVLALVLLIIVELSWCYDVCPMRKVCVQWTDQGTNQSFPSTSWLHKQMIFFLNFWNSMSASTLLWQPSNAVQLVDILLIVFRDYGILCLICLWLCQTVVQQTLETSKWSATR